jgi:hypothetical protein
MAWINLFADLRSLTREAKRIADALERAYPVPADAGAVDDDVLYYDEQKAALQEALDDMKKRGDAPADAELPTEEDDVLAGRD